MTKDYFKLAYDSEGNMNIYSKRYIEPIAKVSNEWECKDLIESISNEDVDETISELEDSLLEKENKIEDLEEEIKEYASVLRRIDDVICRFSDDKEYVIDKIKESLKGIFY